MLGPGGALRTVLLPAATAGDLPAPFDFAPTHALNSPDPSRSAGRERSGGASPEDPAQELARLVHAGLLEADAAKAALADWRAEGRPDDLPDRVERAAGWPAGEYARRRARDPEQPPSLPGYRIEACLGRGGTAHVWRAQGTREGGRLALKVLHYDCVRDAPTRDAFLREAKLLAQLEHPNLVRGFGPAKSGEVLLSRLEWIDGETALERLDREGALDESHALQVVLSVARALSYLGEAGLVHRDVKPGNVMLEEGGRVVLIDLGFAAEESSVDRAADSAVGTAAYLSPEQALGGAAADPRSDVYSLGATLFHLVVGRLPFEASDNDELLAKQVLESLASPELKGRGVSPYLQFFIGKMMSKDADQRFQTWPELIAEIESTLEAVERLNLSGMREQGRSGSNLPGSRRGRRRPN